MKFTAGGRVVVVVVVSVVAEGGDWGGVMVGEMKEM